MRKRRVPTSREITPFYRVLTRRIPLSHLNTIADFVIRAKTHRFDGGLRPERSVRFPESFSELALLVLNERDKVRKVRTDLDAMAKVYEQAHLFENNPREYLRENRNAVSNVDATKVFGHIRRIQQLRDREHALNAIVYYLMENREGLSK